MHTDTIQGVRNIIAASRGCLEDELVSVLDARSIDLPKALELAGKLEQHNTILDVLTRMKLKNGRQTNR